MPCTHWMKLLSQTQINKQSQTHILYPETLSLSLSLSLWFCKLCLVLVKRGTSKTKLVGKIQSFIVSTVFVHSLAYMCVWDLSELLMGIIRDKFTRLSFILFLRIRLSFILECNFVIVRVSLSRILKFLTFNISKICLIYYTILL